MTSAGRTPSPHERCHEWAADAYDHGYRDGAAVHHRFWWGEVFCLGMLGGIILFVLIGLVIQ